jgi:hypothetical protein
MEKVLLLSLGLFNFRRYGNLRAMNQAFPKWIKVNIWSTSMSPTTSIVLNLLFITVIPFKKANIKLITLSQIFASPSNFTKRILKRM